MKFDMSSLLRDISYRYLKVLFIVSFSIPQKKDPAPKIVIRRTHRDCTRFKFWHMYNLVTGLKIFQEVNDKDCQIIKRRKIDNWVQLGHPSKIAFDEFNLT